MKNLLSLVLLVLALLLLSVSVVAEDFVEDKEFTVASYQGVNAFVGAGKNIEQLEDSTYWVLDSRETLNIKYVAFVGRIADVPPYTFYSSEVNKDANVLEALCLAHQPWHDQYAAFAQAVKPLTSDEMPVGVSFSFHDYLPNGQRRTNLVDTYYPTSAYMLEDTYECDYYDDHNSYTVVENNGTKFMVFSLELWPRKAVLDWFISTVQANLDKYVIVYTNSFSDTAGEMYTMWDWAGGFKYEGTTNLKNYNLANSGTPRDGKGIWDYAMAQFDNILAVISAYADSSDIVTGKAVNERGVETALVSANSDKGANAGGPTLLITKFSEDLKEVTFAWATAFKGVDESSAKTVKLNKIGTLQEKDSSDYLPKIALQYNGANKAYILGYEGNTFRPNANMTRAEACTIFARLLLGVQTIPDGYTTRFEDVKKGDWFYNAVAYLDESGFFYRNESTTYKPNEPITRAEFVELANLASTLAASSTVSFTDVPEDHFYYESIMAAAASGLVNGYEDATFRPDKTITRAEVVTVINRLLGLNVSERTIDETRLENEFVDISDHWGRLNVLMASNSNVHGAYYYDVSLDGITESTTDITIANKHFSFTIDKKNGKVTDIVNLATKTSVIGTPTTPQFIYLVNEKDVNILPTKLELEGNRIKVTFKDKNVVYLLIDVSDNFVTVEIDSALPKSIKRVTFANLTASSTIVGEGYLLNSMGMSAWTKVDKFGYSTSSASSIGHSYTIYDKGTMGAKMGIVFSKKEDAIPFLKKLTDTIDTKYGLASKAGGAYARDWETNFGDYIICTTVNPETLDKTISLAKELGVDQFDIHQGANTFIQGDFTFAFTETGTATEFYEKFGKKFEEAGIVTGLHTYAYYISPSAKKLLSNSYWHDQLRIIPKDTLTLSKDLTATNRNVKTVENATNIKFEGTFFSKNSKYVRIDNEIIAVGKTIVSGLTGCTRGACGTTATTHKAGAKVYHLEGYFGMLVPELGSELFYHIADLTAAAYNEGGFNMIYLDAIDGIQQHTPAGHESWYYHSMFVQRILSQCERTPVIETSNNSVRDWNFRGRCGAWDYSNYAFKKHIQIHATSNTQWVNANQSSTLGWFNFFPDLSPALGLKNTFQKTLFHDDIDFLGLQAYYYNSSMVYDSFSYTTVSENPYYKANILYYNEYYSKLRKAHYFSDEVIEKVKKIGGEWRVIEKDGKYVFEQRAYNGTNFGNAIGIEDSLKGENPFKKQTPYIRVESRYSTLLNNAYRLLEFDETKAVGAENVVKTFTAINLNTTGSVITVKVKGTGKDGDAMLLSLSHGSNDSNGRRDHFIDLNFEGWREFILLDSDNAEYDVSKYKFKGITTDGAAYVTYRYVPTMTAINRLTIRTCGATGKNAMIDDVILQPHSEAPIKNPTVTVGNDSITFMCEMKGGEYLEYLPETGKAILYHSATQTTEEVSFKGSITVDKGSYEALFFAEAQTLAPIRVRLVFGFSGQQIGN